MSRGEAAPRTANGKVLLAFTENLPGDLSLKTPLEAIAVLCKKAAGEISASPGKTRSPELKVQRSPFNYWSSADGLPQRCGTSMQQVANSIK